MDSNTIFFSSNFQTSTLQPSSPLLSSINRPLISRQFLGFTHTLRPPGSASSLRKKYKKLGFTLLQSPRFIVRASMNSNFVLVVIGVTALSALSLACYNQFFRRSETSRKVSGFSLALPQKQEGKDLVIQTADSQIFVIGDLQRVTFEKEKDGLTEKMREVTDASRSKEALSQFQETTVVNDDSLLAKASESNGAVQPLMFATEMSELHLEEVERVNEFEADLPRLAVESASCASSVLIEDADVLVGEGEVTRYYDIFRESVREELHTFYEDDQLVAKSSTNLNGLTLKPASSHVFSPNSNNFSSLKQNSELNMAQLSAKNSLQTAGYATKRHLSL